MWVGLTTAAPDTLTLPSCACGWECAVVMNSDCVDECGIRVSTRQPAKTLDPHE